MRTFSIALLAFVLAASPAGAQDGSIYNEPLTYGAINTGLGMLTAGVTAAIGGEPILAAVTGGALGGALNYAGLRMVGTGNPWVRTAGIQTVSIGSSVIRNAGLGDGHLSRFSLFLPPFLVEVAPADGWRVQPRVMVSSVQAIGCFALGFGDVRVDTEQLRYGTVALQRPGYVVGHGSGICASSSTIPTVMALHRSGILLLPDSWLAETTKRKIVAHETVHIAQRAREVVLFSVPISDAALDHVGGRWGAGIARWIVLDFVSPIEHVSGALGRLAPPEHQWENRYLEREADVFAGNDVCLGNSYRWCVW